ncbi:MAG TPA: trehalose-phosphatase [Rudaea sp.]|jgi:trehalose 6-phosphate phosphatase|nr:trehalose-phosphatase [Rudaea sp.]
MNALAVKSMLAEFPRKTAPIPKAGERWALFLDVDGTLVEFQPLPEMVHIPDTLLRNVCELHHVLDGALAFVSGRTLEQLDHLFAPMKLPSAGQYGMERRDGNGALHGVILPDASVAEVVREHAYELLSRFPGLKVEDKGYSIALHYRAAPHLVGAITTAAEAIVAPLHGMYEVQPGALVQEIKPSTCSKGAAVRAFLAEAPFDGRIPVFLGDDFADESAFAAVNTLGGISIAVGTDRYTQADYALSGPAAARRWLSLVLNALSS